jgi:Polysaccharide deacetylase
MHASGHQIASHTWGHEDLSKLSTELMENQIYYNEMALRNILGFFPQYMRPPYSSCNAACTAFLKRAGYHITLFDLDTEDYLHPDAIQISEAYVAGNLTRPNREWLVIGHDIIQQESYRLTEYMLQQFQRRSFRMVTVGECVGDPPANWYRYPNATDADAAAAPPPPPPPQAAAPRAGPPMDVSRDAKCGPPANATCRDSQFGNCCSQNGWCGSRAEYCVEGCQAGFGLCGPGEVRNAAGQPNGGALIPSLDASCGGTKGYTCAGSRYGECCSQAGWW